jgi:hypothetical protein
MKVNPCASSAWRRRSELVTSCLTSIILYILASASVWRLLRLTGVFQDSTAGSATNPGSRTLAIVARDAMARSRTASERKSDVTVEW